MDLRNKKTGQTGYYLHTHRDHNTGTLKVAVLKDGKPFSEFKPYEPIYDYDSLAELNDEWEDYKPREPLIKDEKIRKAVRAWAEANGREYLLVIKSGGRLEVSDGSPHLIYISFHVDNDTLKSLDDRTYYPIAELCGEEEE